LIEFCDEQLALGSKRRKKFQLDGFADLGGECIGKRWVIQQFSVSESAVCKTRTGVIIKFCKEEYGRMQEKPKIKNKRLESPF